MREQVSCFLSTVGALGNCCNRVKTFGIAGIDGPPFDSNHTTAQRVQVLIRVSFGVFRFPAQDKGRLGDLQLASNVIFRTRYHAITPFAKTSILMLSTVISFAFTLSWLHSVFVVSVKIPRPTASVLVLNSHSIPRNLSSDVEKSSTSSANLKFVRQSSVLSLYLMPFLFVLPRF